MTNSLKFLQTRGSLFISKLKGGTVVLLLFALFVLLSIPVYIFRLFTSKLAKLIRPDFGDILNGQSAIFVNDYFRKTATRSNVVSINYCEGVVTYEDVKNRVMSRLIKARDPFTRELLYKKLQQYPVKWLGFAFWKKAYNTFSIDNHVHKHSGKNSHFTERQMTKLVEKLVNTRFSKRKSPWEFHVIENYQYEETALLRSPNQKKKEQQQHGIILFRFHHCLTDGTGIMKVLLETLLENCTVGTVKRPKARKIKRSILQKFWFWLSFPDNLIVELSYLLSLNLKTSPWKVADQNQKWRQVYAKSELIPIDLIKEIKNTFEVSFTSVLLSVISGAVEKSKRALSNVRSTSTLWPFTSVRPVLVSNKNRKALENHFTAVIFDLPIKRFSSELERLKAVDEALKKSKNSTVPCIVKMLSTIVGAHLLCVGNFLIKNRQIPMALTNFTATPEKALTVHKHAKIIQIDAAVGGMVGEMGVVLATVGHNGNLRINITAEDAIMTTSKVKQFAKHINEEVQNLRNLMLVMNKSVKRQTGE